MLLSMALSGWGNDSYEEPAMTLCVGVGSQGSIYKNQSLISYKEGMMTEVGENRKSGFDL